MSSQAASLRHLPLFIYGTLLPGQPNDHYLAKVITSQKEAIFPHGLLYAFPSFPMLIEPKDGNGMAVKGLLIEIDPQQYIATVEQLDQLEEYDPNNPHDSPYTREIRQVQTAIGKSIQVWTYIGKIQFVPEPRHLISSGDWVQYCADNGSYDSLQSWWLSYGGDLLLGKSNQSD